MQANKRRFWRTTCCSVQNIMNLRCPFHSGNFTLPSETHTFDVDEHELVKRHSTVVGHHFSGLNTSKVYILEVLFTCQSSQGTTSQSWVFSHWEHIRMRTIYLTALKKFVWNDFISSHVESIQWLKCVLKSHFSLLGSSWPPQLLCWASARCKPVSGRLELPGHVEDSSSLLCCGRASLTACALLLMWLAWKKINTCEKHCLSFIKRRSDADGVKKNGKNRSKMIPVDTKDTKHQEA